MNFESLQIVIINDISTIMIPFLEISINGGSLLADTNPLI